MKIFIFIAAITWAGLWFTPDQQGRRALERGDFPAAATAFHDPMWQGIAWYRAGEFEKAAQVFARRNTAEGNFNQGNSWLMHGQYPKAIACYNDALVQRADWKEAVENRDLAAARAKMTAAPGGDQGDQKLGADKIVFDKKKNNEGQETQVNTGQAVSDSQMQALWLRRVQTRPADFLKAKFEYQQATEGGQK